jgi:DNA-binding beta-propeller fold protein YncE
MKREAHLPRHATAAILALLLAALLAPADASSKVYFSAFLPEGTGIERAGFDGGSLQTLQSEPAGFEDGLALDTAGGRMYWTDTNASVIASANLNGTGSQIVLDDFGQEPLGIALDLANSKMYWTDREGVKRANLDGTGRELLTKEPARGFCVLDLTAKRIYWADWPSGDIKSAAMSPEPTVTNIVTKQAAPFGVAVDHRGGKLYWLELNLNKKKREKNEIRRANLDGTEVQTLVERPGAGFEGGLAIDPVAGKLYWSEAETRDIGVSNLDGSQAQTLLSTGEAVPVGLAVETSEPHRWAIRCAATRATGRASASCSSPSSG